MIVKLIKIVIKYLLILELKFEEAAFLFFMNF